MYLCSHHCCSFSFIPFPLTLLSFMILLFFIFFFFNDTATTEIYTLSLHDALPILRPISRARLDLRRRSRPRRARRPCAARDRKSTRLNSSHANISYAVFCLKKKKKTK